MQYVLFLRGINLGTRKVKMDELKSVLKNMGYHDAQTLLASGNVLIGADADPDASAIEKALEDHFGFHIGVVMRSVEALKKMVASDPFDGVPHNDDQHLFVTFTNGEIGTRLDQIKPVEGVFAFPRIDKDQFYQIGYRQPNGRYSEWQVIIEKPLKELTITTRNWNTVLRMIDKADQKAKD